MQLTDGTATVDLPDDLLWVDEFGWAGVSQVATYTVTGALVVETGQMQSGRPITLHGSQDSAWVSYATLQQLQTWAQTSGQQLTLTLRGSNRTVMFDARAGATGPIQAQPVVPYGGNPVSADWYTVTLKFFEA